MLSQPSAIEKRFLELLAARLGTATGELDPTRRFSALGLDSATAAALVAELEADFGRSLPPTLVWDHPTPRLAARYLASGESHGEAPLAAASVADGEPAFGEPVAVVGISCRFPGAGSVPAFERLLEDAVDAITEVPRERWDDGGASPGRGGFLDRVDGFDAAFFGLSPREARQVDPQQRLMLELAWEALEDAGIVPGALRGSRTGVFCGAMWNDYARVAGPRFDAVTQHTATGQDSSIIAARVSYTLGLQGPSLTVNTACSSSLVAAHLACSSLRAGESSLALAGGVNLMLDPHSTVAMARFGALAPDGRSKAFDARADGYVRGEGGGFVVLEPLSRALAAGHEIYCLILGSAVNNDGFSNGLTAPNPRAQEAVLRDAYRQAGVAPAAVGYVEAHGTGTLLGDPIEARALGAILGAGRDAEYPLRVGSVKTNVGHLEAAAGIAGLIKVASSLRRRRLYPSLHFETPNPHIPFAELGLAVQRRAEDWPETGERAVAGVSSFGFGGTNCHLVAAASGIAGAARLDAPPVLVGAPEAGVSSSPPRLVFVFSGNGSQYPEMARELLREPAAHAVLERCDLMLRPRLRWSLLKALACADAGRLSEPVAAQLALFAVQTALVEVWRRRGVEPDAVVGHSVGEVAAAHCAGALSLTGALALVEHRSRLQSSCAGAGGMTVVDLDAREVEARLAAAAAGEVGVACLNAPRSTVISGPSAALEGARAALSEAGVEHRPVRVDVPYHSILMAAPARELRDLLEIRPRPAEVPMMSTVTGAEIAGERLDAEYWARNLRRPVRFLPAIEALAQSGHDHFLEIAPHPILERSTRECLEHLGQDSAETRVLASARRDEGLAATLGGTLGALRAAGRPTDTPGDGAPLLLPLSAHVAPALRDVATATAELLEERGDVRAADVCASAAVRRHHHDHRLAVFATSRGELAERLRAFAAGRDGADWWHGQRPPAGPAKRVFVFSGHGGQWPEMGRRLLTVRAFREALARCDDAFREPLGRSRQRRAGETPSVAQLLTSGPLPEDNAVLQPLLVALQIALAATWRAWGVEPDAVVGHSLGEISAAAVAGALSLDDAALLCCRRASVLEQLAGRGAMVLTELSPEAARRLVSGREDRIAVGIVNGPRSTVLSGDAETLGEVARELERRAVFCRRVRIGHAAHSPQIDAVRDALEQAFAAVRPRPAAVPIYSTVTGEACDGSGMDGDYWLRNLRQPVLFGPALERLLDDGHGAFVEINAHPLLAPVVDRALRERGSSGVVIPSLRRSKDDRAVLARGVGRLYATGQRVAWKRFAPPGRFVRLPSYPWQRRRFWIETVEAPGNTPVDRAAAPPESPGPGAPEPGAPEPGAPEPGPPEPGTSEPGPPEPGAPLGPLWQLTWRAAPLPAAPARRTPGRCLERTPGRCLERTPGRCLERPPGRWLIFADRGGVATRVTDFLEARGETCRRVYWDPEPGPAAYRRWLDGDDGGSWRGVVHLWSLDLEAPVEDDWQRAPARAARRGWHSVLELVQGRAGGAQTPALAAGEQPKAPRLWLVTRGAQAAAGAPTLAGVLQAPLWGLGAVVAAEHPELRPTLVDLDGGGDPLNPDGRVAGALARELWHDDDAERVALDATTRRVARLAPLPAPDPEAAAATALDPGGTYLVTGGLGALGRAACEVLIDRGARHLLLVGRNAGDAAADGALAELRRRGAEVVTRSVDVARPEAVERLLADVAANLPPLRGIVHAAGVGDDDPLRRLDRDRFQAVLDPKLGGAWNLHHLTRDRRLDVFILFSSVSGVLGFPGQASYAAGNAFLDALAEHRGASGRAGLSLDWPGWTGQGMAAGEGGRDFLGFLGRQGIRGIDRAAGKEMLGRLLGRRRPAQIAVLPLDGARLAEACRHARVPALLARLQAPRPSGAWPESTVSPAATPAASAADRLRARLEGLAAPRRRRELIDYVRSQLAQVLELEPAQVGLDEPFQGLGLGSLMAVELHGRLEVGTGATLSATVAWQQPTARQLAEHLAERMGVAIGAEPDAAAGDDELDSLLAEIEQLPEEESRRLLL